MSGIGLITAGYTSPTIGAGGSGGGIAYDYSVLQYTDLPVNPPDGIVIWVTNETITDAYVKYNAGSVVYELIRGSVTNIAQLPSDPIAANVSIDGNCLINVNGEVSYLWNGSAWVRLDPTPTDFVSDTIYADVAALETAFPAASNNLKFGLATRSSVTTLYRSNATSWLAQSVDGSVATFSALPTDVVDGVRYGITGETGLSNLYARWDEGDAVWYVDQVTAAYTVYSPIEWGSTPGRWYNSGGITVDTAAGCELNDTTNLRVFYWNATDYVFVPYDVYSGTIANVKKIKGDDATLTGWSKVTAAGGGTATVTTDGSKVTFAATNPGSGGASAAYAAYADTSITTSAKVYWKGMVTMATPTGNQARTMISIQDGGNNSSGNFYEFGSTRVGGSTQSTGQWYTAATYVAYTAVAAGTEAITTEKFVEMIKGNGFAQIRIAGGPWRAISSATARSGTNNGTVFAGYAGADENGATTASMSVRYVASMRY